MDAIELPPVRREYVSAGGRFRLLIESPDGWRSPQADASLFMGTELLWRTQLEHHHGPRFVLLSPQGQVLLVDEWIRVASRRALQLHALDGRRVVRYSLHELIERLGVTPAQVNQAARFGPWLAAEPQLSTDGSLAQLRLAGRSLWLAMGNGSLRAG